MFYRQQPPRLGDVVSLYEIVDIKQRFSHKDPVAARKLNALNSRTASTNYRVCKAHTLLNLP